MIKLWGQVCFTKATSTTHLTIPMINDNYNFPTIRRNWTNKCNAIETIIRTMLYTCVVRYQELLYSKLRYFQRIPLPRFENISKSSTAKVPLVPNSLMVEMKTQSRCWLPIGSQLKANQMGQTL